MSIPQDNLLTRLGRADVVCKDCGTKYGKYSVGCSSTWNGTCGVCGENKPVTEVRDWGYLTKGIHAERAKIKEQSLEVANYIACQEEIASQETDNHPITPSQELVDKWVAMLEYCEDIDVFTDVARWGADCELDACSEWLKGHKIGDDLRRHRRPKPPSLKEQALAELELLRGDANAHGLGFDAPAIRRALEALPE